ncbi:MAG: hypothetical protein Q3980_11580 [Turicibacter sp.]|nr:hypothetical protein [Turicibacter sp.]MDO5793440.1 hypothetical protein [Turicibacter sp.]
MRKNKEMCPAMYNKSIILHIKGILMIKDGFYVYDVLLIQISLILCVILVVLIGLIYLLAYDKQQKRQVLFEQQEDERKKGNPFLF